MPYPKPQVIELDSRQPRLCGQQHGELLRKSIAQMAHIRLELMLNDAKFACEEQVLELARAHLPVLEDFDPHLYEELLGIAEGSSLSPEQIVILNHYTDMRDIDPRTLNVENAQDPGGCSALYVPGVQGPLLGQTWDVHGTALDHVIVLRIKQHLDGSNPSETGDALVFSVAGCLGMTGLNHMGLGVTINNLNSLDAGIGIIWPALVRKILRQRKAELARDLVMKAPLGSGHHYLIADTQEVFGIETSGIFKKVTQTGSDEIHYHTNHCLDAHMAKTEKMRPGSTTHERYTELGKLLAEKTPDSAQELYEAFGRVSIPKSERFPANTATCGAMVMNLGKREVLSCKGSPSVRMFQNPPLKLEIE